MLKILFFSWALLAVILLEIEVVTCETFLDKVPPVIIWSSTEEQKSLFSYSITGKSAQPVQGRLQSKLFIGSPVKGSKAYNYVMEQSKESKHIRECEVSLSMSDQTRGNNEVTCKSLPQPEIPKLECKDGNPNVRVPQYTSSFGSTLVSSDKQDHFITCDFKWRQTPDCSKSAVRGMCYQTSTDGTGKVSNVMIPKFSCFNEKCDDLNYYALFGFSAVFINASAVLVGTPGHFNYQGAVMKAILEKGSTTPMKVTLSAQLNNYDYFGYSITSGAYFTPKVQRFAIGTPRGKTGKGLVLVIDLNRPTVDVEQLVGDQFGCYFGSVLASIDLNADGLDELLVGAPMYKKISYDEGCVFVYSKTLNTGKFFTSSEPWCPNDVPGGRFGTSIAPLGDINDDGYGDVAISAPYAETGRVYIYFGGSSRPLTEFVVISSPAPAPAIKGFGTTIVGKVDFDGNGTPDFAVGSFESKTIALYLTRPRMVLSVTFGFDQPNKFTRGTSELTIKPTVCIQRKFGRKQLLPQKLNVWVKVVVDSQVSPSKKRFLIIPAVGNEGVKSIEFSLMLDSRTRTPGLCNMHMITVVPQNLQPNDVEKLVLEWQVWYNETGKEFELNSTEVIDIDNKRRPPVSPTRKSFCSLCPAPTEPVLSNYIVELGDNCDEDGDPKCSPELEITSMFYETGHKELTEVTIGTTQSVQIRIVLRNKKETLYNPQISVTLISSGITTNISHRDVKFDVRQCYSNNPLGQETISLSCQEIVMHKNSQEEFTGVLNLNNLKATPQLGMIELRVEAFPAAQPDLKKISPPKTLLIKSEVNLELKAIGSKGSTPLSDREINEFFHQFEIRNTKVSPLASVELAFKFPKSYGNDIRPVMTLVSVTSSIATVSCYGYQFDLTVIARPEQLQQSASRQRRAVEEPTSSNKAKEATHAPDPDSVNSVRLGCGEKNWECDQLTCTATASFPTNVFNIELKYRINSTLARKLNIIQDESMELQVMTLGLLKAFDGNDWMQATATQVITITSQDAGPTAIELILAGFGGLILLFLIIVGLFKCGFFRRKTKEELEALKARTEEEENLANNFPINDDRKENEDEE